MNEIMRQIVNDYIEKHMPDYLRTLYDVISIVSPPGSEQKKAAWILDQLHAMGEKEAYQDEAGNVICPHAIDGVEKFPLYTAHMDTVFAGIDAITPEIEGNILRAPSCGDNSSDVAALLFLLQMLRDLKQKTPAVFAFNVGEEGLGNLKGSKALTDAFGDRLSYFVAVDGHNDRFVNLAVGSHRYAVHVVTVGGHSYAAFGNANAINEAAAIIRDFYALKVPKDPRTTYNVGTIQGGTTINSIAAEVEFTVDMRSVSAAELEKLDAAFHQILQAHTSDKVKVDPETGGAGYGVQRQQHRCQRPPQPGYPCHGLWHQQGYKNPHGPGRTGTGQPGTGLEATGGICTGPVKYVTEKQEIKTF